MAKSKKHEKKSKKSKKHKHKEHKEKRKSKKLKKSAKEKSDNEKKVNTPPDEEAAAEATQEQEDNFAIPVELMNKSHLPETPEEYRKRQSEIRRLTDPVTGRVRLIKGDSEILEEIVTKGRHAEINRSATQGDGRFFQEKTVGAARKQKR